MFSCEYCKIFKNIYFEDHLQTAASASWSILYKEFVDISYENASFGMQAPWSILYKKFVDISYENASFGIQEDSIWLQLIYFLTTIAFWPMKYLFRMIENCVAFIAQISHYGKFTALHKLILIVLQLTN